MIKKIFFLAFIFINIAFSHPHTFIELYSLISKDNNNLKIHIKWYFDEMTSQMFIMDFDMNKNNIFDKNEVKFIQKEAFEHLDQYSYYAYIEAHKKQIKQKATNFNTYLENNKVVYEFDYILDYTLLDKNLSLTFKDEEMFMAFVIKNDSFKTTNNIKTKLVELNNEYFFGYKLEINK